MEAWYGSLVLKAKEAAKRVLLAVGLEIAKVSRRRNSLAALVKHVLRMGFRPKTVIDVGVGHGTPELYGAFPGATLLLVDPLEEYKSVMEDVARKHKTEYVSAAAGAEWGTIVLNVPPGAGRVFGLWRCGGRAG